MGYGEESVGLTCFFVHPAYRLAPCGETILNGVHNLEAFALPLLAGFKDGEIVKLLVVDTKQIVDALIRAVLFTEFLAEDCFS